MHLEDVITQYQQGYGEHTQLTREGAMDEIAADYTQFFLEDTQLFRDFMGKSAEHRGVIRKFLDAVKAVVDKIRKTFSSKKAQYDAAREALGKPLAEVEQALKLWEEAYAEGQKAVKNAPVRHGTGEGNVRQSSVGTSDILNNGYASFKEWEVEGVVREALTEKKPRNATLIKLGNLHGIYSQIIGSKAEIYVNGNHLYENMVDEKTAILEGRFRKNAHYHNLGDDTVVSAIMALDNPAILIAENGKENPTIFAVLPVNSNDGGIYAALSFYNNEAINGQYTRKPHVVLTISPIPSINTNGRQGLESIISDAIRNKAIIFMDKKLTETLPVNAQNINLGIVTESSVKENLSQFQKYVKTFKEKNRINYSVAGTENILRESSERIQAEKETLDQFDTIRAELAKGKIIKPEAVEKLARDVIRSWGSDLDSEAISRDLQIALDGAVKAVGVHKIYDT